MANGNGMTVTTAKMILAIAQAILILLVTGIGGLMLKQRDTLTELKAQVQSIENRVLYRLDRTENLLDLHLNNHNGGE